MINRADEAKSLPLCGMVILNFNCQEFLDACISSALNQDYDKLKVYVVDNASTDKSKQIVRSYLDRVKLISLPFNTGFSGFNVGISEALREGCRFVFWMDSDAELDRCAVSSIVEYMTRHPEVGIVAPLQYHYPNDVRSNKASIRTDSEQTKSANRVLFAGQLLNYRTMGGVNAAIRSTVVNCDYVGNSMIRSEILELMKFDPAFFTYYSDTDFCLRVKKMGYKIVCLTTSKIYATKKNASSKIPGLRGYLAIRNKCIFMRKHLPPTKWLALFPVLARDFVTRLAFWTIKGSSKDVFLLILGSVCGLSYILRASEPGIIKSIAIRILGNAICLEKLNKSK